MNCLLVASPDSGLALEDPGIVDFSCTDRSKFGAARDADIWEKFEELAAQLLKKGSGHINTRSRISVQGGAGFVQRKAQH